MFVTNGMQYASQAGNVIVLEAGRVAQRGRPQELAAKGGPYRHLMETHAGDVAGAGSESPSPSPSPSPNDEVAPEQAVLESSEAKLDGAEDLEGEDAGEAEKGTRSRSGSKGERMRSTSDGDGHALMKAEERAEGQVAFRVYAAYAAKVGGPLVLAGIAFAFSGFEGSKALTQWWLSHWSDSVNTADAGSTRTDPWYFLSIYSATVVLTAVMLFTRVSIAYLAGLRAARRLHKVMLRNVLRAPMSWFDTTPLGEYAVGDGARCQGREARKERGWDEMACVVHRGEGLGRVGEAR